MQGQICHFYQVNLAINFSILLDIHRTLDMRKHFLTLYRTLQMDVALNITVYLLPYSIFSFPPNTIYL